MSQHSLTRFIAGCCIWGAAIFTLPLVTSAAVTQPDPPYPAVQTTRQSEVLQPLAIPIPHPTGLSTAAAAPQTPQVHLPQANASGASRLAVGSAPGTGFIRLPGHVPDLPAQATPIEPAAIPPLTPAASAPILPMTLTLVFRRDDQIGFERYLKDVYDPESKQFRQFLTQAQITGRFGPARSVYDALLSHLRNNGFALVETSKNRMTVTVQGTRAATEQLFALGIRDYSIGAARFYTNDSDPVLPVFLANKVQAINGLSSFAVPSPAIKSVIYQKVCGATPGGGNRGNQSIKQCVNLTNALYGLFRNIVCGLSTIALAAGKDPLVFGTGLVIVIACNASDISMSLTNLYEAASGPSSLESGSNPTEAQTRAQANLPLTVVDGAGQTIGLLEFDTFNRSDVVDYLALIGAPASRIDKLSAVAVNGGVPVPGSGETEVLLDIDAVMTLAPGANVVVYSAPFDGRATSYSTIFNAMIDDGVTIISNSWASCEDQVSRAEVMSIEAVLQTAAASGISVFNAVGDSGSTCLDGSPNTISVPSGSPSATAVGGTSWPQGLGPGQTYGPEVHWDGTNDVPATGQGGFGISRYFARPDYQNGVNSSAARSVPDVVIRADPANGIIICQASAGGCPSGTLNGGTSLSAPEWAAATALLNDAQGRNMGALNPALYALANTDAFHDAASMNSDFARVGLGSPNLNVLNRLLGGQAEPGLPDAVVSQVFPLIQPVIDTLRPDGSFVAPADGTSPSGVQVTLLDARGNTVSGKTVTLNASGGSAIVTPASAVTSVDNGAAIFTITNLTPETITFTATDVTDGIILAQTAEVNFGVPSATSAGLNVFPTTVKADGIATTTITVTLKDVLNRPTPGKQISISQGDGHSIITGPAPAVTGADGTITFTASNQTNETVTYTALDVSDGNLPIPGMAVVTFNDGAGPPCGGTVPTAAPGFTLSSFATGFVARGFSFSNINFGCAGASSPAFDASGAAFIADFPTGDLFKLPPGGGTASNANRLSSLGLSLGSLVTGRDGQLYATRFATGGGFSTGDVIQIDQSTGAIVRVLASRLTCPFGLAVDPLSGDLFFVDQCFGAGADNPGLFRISGVDTAAPTTSVYATLPFTPNGQIAFTPNGTLYALTGYTRPTPSIVRISGTDVAGPPVITTVAGITSDNLSVAVGKLLPNGDARSLIVHTGNAVNAGVLQEIDITVSPPVVLTTIANGDIGAGIIGPDGCFYNGTFGTVFRIGNSSGNCGFTPTNPVPSISLTPATVAPDPLQGSTQMFTATLSNVAAPAGLPVFFFVDGANPQFKLVRADAQGIATLSYILVNAGKDTVNASVGIEGTPPSPARTLTSNPAQVTSSTGQHLSFLTLNPSPQSGILDQPVEVIASLADVSAEPTAVLANQFVDFSLGTATCRGVTDSRGRASCQISPNQTGMLALTANFIGTPQFVASNAVFGFNVLVAPPPPGTLQFSAATYSVNEGAGSAAITVTRAGASGGTVTVKFASSDGNARVADRDYGAVNGTLTFADGETSKTFIVPISDDSAREPAETINLALSDATGNASVGTPASAVLTILASDQRKRRGKGGGCVLASGTMPDPTLPVLVLAALLYLLRRNKGFSKRST